MVEKFTFELIDGDRCIPITDGMRDMGLPDGVYVYNGVKYESKNGTSRYFDGTLIGTSLGLIQLLLRLMEFTSCSLEKMPEGTPDATLLIATSWQALNRAIQGNKKTMICDCTVLILFAAFFIESNLNYIIKEMNQTSQMIVFLGNC